jgi:MFS transporter, YNFM family, putative membrane transport protein
MTVSEFTGHLPGSRAYRRLLLALFFAGVATFAQLYAPQAVLPLLADDLGISPETAALTVSASTLGLAAAVIPWSLVADRIGRVPAMGIGIVAATCLGALVPLSPAIGVLLGIRFLEGAALGAIPAIALAYLSEEVAARHAAAAAGSYVAGTTIGGLSGRLIAGPVGDLAEWRAGTWAASALCVVAAVLFLWLVPRARGFRPGRYRTADGPGVAARILVNLRSRGQLALYAQGFLLMGAFVATYNYLGFHLTAPPFDLPSSLVTLLFLAYLGGTAASPWAGALASRWGRPRVLALSTAVMAAGAAVMLVPATVVILVGLVLLTAGFFGAHSVASGWVPAVARPDTRAQASSLYYLGYYAGSSILGWCLGFVFSGAGWGWFLGAVIALCALAALIAVLAPSRVSAPRRPPARP